MWSKVRLCAPAHSKILFQIGGGGAEDKPSVLYILAQLMCEFY